MTPAQISTAKGGNPFTFQYEAADIADTFVFDSENWGLFLADNVEVTDKVRPTRDIDGITSLPGSWTASVTLFHLDTFSSAHVTWEGTDVTVEYTLNGTTWTALSQNDAINLSGTPDLDIRVSFDGGVVEDPAELTRLTVYVLKTDTIKSALRTLTFSADSIVDGTLEVNASDTVNAAAETDGVIPLVGTIEAYVTLTSGTAVFGGLPAHTLYVNGVVGTPSAGAEKHVVAVLTTPANIPFTIGPNLVIRHLAVYPQAMSAGEVLALYNANQVTTLQIHDPGTITVSEHAPATDIYAYAWSIVPAGR